MNVGLILEMAAEAAPDRVAVGPTGGGTTYAELLAAARAAGRSFHGRTVAYVGENDVAVPLLLFAAAWAGRPFAPLNYRLADDRLRAVAARTAPAVAVAEAASAPRLAGVDGVEVVPRHRLADATAAAGEDAPGAGPDDPAVLLFTSGTTGEPKAAVLRHRHLTAYIFATVEFLGAGEDEATLVAVPPYHVAAVAGVLSSVYSGRRMVQLPAFEPEAWVDLAAAEAVTHAMVVPTMLGRILDVLQRRGERLPALRHLASGGGKMPPPVVERALEMLPHVDFVNAYGLTETSSTIAVLGPEDHRAAVSSTDPAVRRRLASVGRPLPSVEVEVRAPDGRPLPAGEAGEIWVRGEQVAGEYAGGAALEADGWFCTRDAGYLDDAGYLFVEGRLDDVIVRGGENLSPGEIEAVLLEHPAVAEAAVVGVPDEQWGEQVVAAVVLAPGGAAGEAELQAWVRDRLRSARTPARVAFMAELPHTETGKLLRRVLREELAEA